MIAARKIFIDVGGHEGQSVHVALEPKFAFDEVHTFEPHPDYAGKVVIKERGGLRNWLYAYPTYFSLDPQDVPRAPRLKRQIKYTVRDLRSAVGLSITWRH
jgi:hypothetical protein